MQRSQLTFYYKLFQSGTAATLLNLQLVCKIFNHVITVYEASICSNLSKSYLWAVDYGLGAQIIGTTTLKQLLWCAQLDVLVEFAANQQPWVPWPGCSHIYSLDSGTEYSKRLEHGLAIYQRSVKIADGSRATELQPRHPKLLHWLSPPSTVKAECEDVLKLYLQNLSRIEIFDYELLYLISYSHTRGLPVPRRCCETCRSMLRVPDTDPSLDTRGSGTANSLGPTSNIQRISELVASWAKRLLHFLQFFSFQRYNRFHADDKLEDEARLSISVREYQAIPLAIKIAALPMTHATRRTMGGNHSELTVVIHRYIEEMHPAEAKKARVIWLMAHEFETQTPKMVHRMINEMLGNGDCEEELIPC